MGIEINPDGSPKISPTGPITSIPPAGGIPPNPHVKDASVTMVTDPPAHKLTDTELAVKETRERLLREAEGRAVPFPATRRTVEEINAEKQGVLSQIQAILAEYNGLESSIPHTNVYWDLLNRYRTIER